MKLKIAFLQLVSEGNLEDNLEKGIKACREAKANGADIALFPEMWSSGYTFPHNKEWLEQNSISLNSKYVKQFSEIS
ncbi:carbon-nitrogen hydrolase family protein, partial [Soehngenia saccharolytica]